MKIYDTLEILENKMDELIDEFEGEIASIELKKPKSYFLTKSFKTSN